MAKTEEAAQLRLLMQDADDLAVVSAHVQDAVVQVRDLHLRGHERRFVILMNRFCWEAGERQRPPGWHPSIRVRSGLHFNGVIRVKARGLAQDRKNDVLELLAVTFEPGEPPGGTVHLLFAGGPTLALDVECIDGGLVDLGVAWLTLHRPRHNIGAPSGSSRSDGL